MAVRRARVKPVISLLPWRKNNDAGNNTNTKTLEVETIEKLLKSPQTTLDTSTGIQDNVDKRSPKPDSALKSPLPVKNMFVYQVPSSLTVFPNASQKVWVMSENKVIESQRNVGSPIIGHVVPLLIQNSKAEVNNQRWPPLSPEKIPPMPNQKSEKRPAVTNFFYGKPKIPKKNVTCTIVSSDVPDYDSAPSMTEGTFIDGIVPLQATSTAPNSLVMNGIVSENGEVLFDPIVPLPSLSNTRPKLQPVLRLSSLGKSSVQGSASESKDESGHALPVGYGPSTSAPWKTPDSHTSLSTMPALPNSGLRHVWNDSVISSVIQAPMPSAFTSSPVKDNHVSKCPRLDAARKAAAMRRRAEGTKDTLTMNDLIYYNPTSNPIVPDKDEMKAKEANEEEARKAAKESEGKAANTSGMKANRAPVPQIKLGPNGEIILDEKSLVIKQSEKRTIASSTVHESSTYNTVTARWNRRRPRSKDWTDAETLRFYRALTALGTDFIVMEQLFPDRNRRQLRYKFKKEERVNTPQIEKAIRVAGDWDPKRLLAEFTAEREAEEKAEEQAARERAAELQARAFERQQTRTRLRLSKSAKALGSSVLPSNCSGFTANDIIETYLEVKASKKKAIQRPCKRGGPKSKPSQAPATITQVLPNTQPSDDVATTRNIDSPKPPDKIPDGSSGILSSPGRPANIEDGALVIIPVVDPNNPSKKIYKTYIASKGGKLTLVDPPPPFLEKTLTVLGN